MRIRLYHYLKGLFIFLNKLLFYYLIFRYRSKGVLVDFEVKMGKKDYPRLK